MMGPRDLFIFTTGMGGGPKANVELLLAAKGSNLPEEMWSPDELTPSVPYMILWTTLLIHHQTASHSLRDRK